MKRSERLSNQARRRAWWSAVSLAVSVAIVCWVPAAVLSGESHPGGMAIPVAVGALTLALLGFASTLVLILEAIRLARLAGVEAKYEHEREIRPRI